MSDSTGYYTCQPAGAKRAIHLSFDAIDGILAEVLTGFGAIPRRGAEVGGLLLGRSDAGNIWIDGFVMAACEHRRGPSFLLSDQDREALAQSFHSAAASEQVPVGMFRSNTRDGDAIADEDRTLFHEYFPSPEGAFLLIRPYASKTSTAYFLTYQNGELPDSGPDTFPFLRRELEGGAAPRRRSLGERRPRSSEDPESAPSSAARTGLAPETVAVAAPPEPVTIEAFRQELEPAPTLPEAVFSTHEFEESQYQRRRGWIWIPLSFIFLLLGVLLGFQAALTFAPRQTAVDATAFSLGLSATSKGENVHIKWNRESPAIHAAQHGTLEITDGKYAKTVDLDSGALQTGSVMYPPISDSLSLKLRLTIKGSTMVSETLDWSKTQ